MPKFTPRSPYGTWFREEEIKPISPMESFQFKGEEVVLSKVGHEKDGLKWDYHSARDRINKIYRQIELKEVTNFYRNLETKDE